MTDMDDAVSQEGKPVRRRGSRRVVMVSQVDAKRIAAGEFASVEEVLHASDAKQPAREQHPSGRKPASHKPRDPKGKAKQPAPWLSARDQEILNEVPPHFGKL